MSKKITVEVSPADQAEEAIALNDFYAQRVLALQSMKRTEGERADALEAALKQAEEGLLELRGDVAALTDPTEETEPE